MSSSDESVSDNVVIRPGNVNILKNLVYGGIAGFIGSLSTFWIDTAKTRLQEQVFRFLSLSNHFFRLRKLSDYVFVAFALFLYALRRVLPFLGCR